jgi:methyl-accepting chemotaxis protein
MQAAGRLAAMWREYSRYHGIWAPGVRLIRSVQLRAKALMVMACVGLPIGILAVQMVLATRAEWRIEAASGRALETYVSLRELILQLRDVQRGIHSQDLGDTRVDLKTLFTRESEAYARMAEVMRDDYAGDVEIERALTLLDGERKEAMRRASAPPTPVARGVVGPRAQGTSGYMNQLVTLRVALLDRAALRSHPDEPVRWMYDAAIGPAAQMALLLAQGREMSVALYAKDDAAAPAKAWRLIEIAVELRMLLNLARPHLERSVAHGLLDAQQVDEISRQLREQAALFDRMARVRASMPPGEDFTAAIGMKLEQHLPRARQAVDAALRLEELAVNNANARVHQRMRALQSTALLQALALIAMAAVTGYLLVCLVKVVGGGLIALRENMSKLAGGNLSIRPKGHGRDEVSETLNALAECAGRMSALFEAVQHGVGAVSHASREVAVGNGGLAARNRDIRSAIGSVSQRANGFSVLMESCGEEVARAVDASKALHHDARRSRRAMSGLRERMQVLTSKSREIEHVVRLVETAAFQTKLLALNASVEAARAGAAGKGFAVVAQEVRALAQRNEEAAAMISAIVTSSITEIDKCSHMTENASEALQRTDERIESVSASLQGIVQQTRGGLTESQDVVSITREVEESVGGNTQLVEQLSNASSALRDQGEMLRRSVQHFLVR